MHCIVLGLGVKPNMRNEGRFILEVMKRASILGRRPSWSCMIEVKAFMCFCAFIWHWFVQLGLFGHHASKCVIDGSRVEHYTLLSLRHDKGCSCTHIFLQIHCHASVCALLQQKESLQEEMADWLSSVPIGYKYLADRLKICWCALSPMTSQHIHEVDQKKHHRDLYNFQRCKTVQTEATWGMATDFRAKPTEHACIPRHEAISVLLLT